jgi:non-specific serine/threonine protein kinase/serine/threonine-protein kinase
MQQRLVEDEPPKPSTRLSRLGKESAAVARRHHTDAGSLMRDLRGDLDWITMMAMAKDRNRRYETANALALDIRRFLEDEPVRASPPTAGYRLRKFARRHRVPVAAGSVAALALVAGLVLALLGLVQAQRATADALAQRGLAENARDGAVRARDDAMDARQAEAEQRQAAEMARDEAQLARAAETAQRAAAETAAARAQAINRFIVDMLGSADPLVSGRDVRVADVLDDAARRLDTSLDDQPEVEAAVRQSLGVTYRGLGLYDKAGPQLERSLKMHRQLYGPDARDTLHAEEAWAILLHDSGRLDQAEAAYRRLVDARREQFGAGHPSALLTLDALALILQDQGRLAEAEALQREALAGLEAIPDHRPEDATRVRHNLARVVFLLQRFDEAEELARAAHRSYTSIHGVNHPETCKVLALLAGTMMEQGRLDEAEPMFLSAHRTAASLLGEEHPVTLSQLHSLSGLYMMQERYEEAEQIHLDVLAIQQRTLGEHHIDTIVTMNGIAMVRKRLDRLDGAIDMLNQAVAAARASLDPGHWIIGGIQVNLGEYMTLAGRYDEAEACLLDAHRILRPGASLRTHHDTEGCSRRRRKLVTRPEPPVEPPGSVVRFTGRDRSVARRPATPASRRPGSRPSTGSPGSSSRPSPCS